MTEFAGFILDALAEIGGGRGAAENHFTPHLIAVLLWGVLCAYEWSCEKTNKTKGDLLLLIGFGISFICQLTLFTVDALLVKGNFSVVALNPYWPPLEHTIELISSVVLCSAFLQLLLRAKPLALQYLAGGLTAIVVAYVAAAFYWQVTLDVDANTLFANTSGAWILHSVGLVLGIIAIVLLIRSHRRVRYPIVAAFALLSMSEVLMLANLFADLQLDAIVTPIRGNLHIWAIPLLGYASVQVRRGTEKRHEHGIQNYERLESLGQLSSGIAHDFNNHLQIILGYVELARVQKFDADAIEIPLNRIEEAAERAGALVNQLLAFSRGQSADYNHVDLNEIIMGVTPMVSRLLGPDIKLAHNLDMEAKPILADQRMVEQIIVNLIVNARDAMADGGTITVQSKAIASKDELERVSDPGTEQTQLIVSDTGSGMDKQTIRKAFEPFFTTKPVGEGTGLGLATVYGIVQKHKGRILIDSKPGEFTKVFVELPVSVGEFSESEQAQRDIPATGNETILLAEDEVAIRDLAHQLLTSFGYNVLVANDGQHAINIVSTYKGHIDMCLFDVVMPRLNGYQTYAGIEELGTVIPVLFVTGSTSRAEVLKANYNHLQKPYSRTSLLTAVRQLLDETASVK